MQKTIKFRAWCNKNKVMHREWLDIKPNPDEILMQFTGLKDKNGKDCYEGDRVKFRVGGAASKTIEGVVEYFDYYFGAGKGFGLGNLQDLEVIGNVFEGLQNASEGDIIKA